MQVEELEDQPDVPPSLPGERRRAQPVEAHARELDAALVDRFEPGDHVQQAWTSRTPKGP